MLARAGALDLERRAARVAGLVRDLASDFATNSGRPTLCPDGSKGWFATRATERIPTPDQKFATQQLVTDLWVTVEGLLIADPPGPAPHRIATTPSQFIRRSRGLPDARYLKN